eukprot:4527143-Pyramimonas_sp.AAC.1
MASKGLAKLDGLPRLPRPPPPPRAPSLSLVLPPRGVPHELVWDQDVQRFRRIACWSSSRHKHALAKLPCPAPHGTGHTVMKAGPYIFLFAQSGFQNRPRSIGPPAGRA